MSDFAITAYFDIDVDFGSVISLRLFGCIVHTHVPKKFQKRIGVQVVEGTHIGFIKESAWVLHDHEKRRIIKARDVDFFDTGSRECVGVEMDDKDGEMGKWGVGNRSKGVTERQNGDSGGAKVRNNNTSIPKNQNSRIQDPSTLMQRDRTKKPHPRSEQSPRSVGGRRGQKRSVKIELPAEDNTCKEPFNLFVVFKNRLESYSAKETCPGPIPMPCRMRTGDRQLHSRDNEGLSKAVIGTLTNWESGDACNGNMTHNPTLTVLGTKFNSTTV
ncbi:uncharacterized protein EI90DRAFT_3019974 [Cantharellus anzutake]|uniref:uncharacterized protein n=1 Tax=Cantharellus anzutake TaxID=1750568 RepID=UPI0019078B15|nr:uncharacterized protein EI90DRAFT_3019974 [Cantharellus anzutake]KAF8322913.1 hypothetical protein EI90DRAFT_3019974 [Cantharellus anzutake]